MPLELIRFYLNVPLVALVFARLAGMIMFQPIFGSLGIPIIVRALLIIALTLLIVPFTALPADAPDTLAGLGLALGGELLLGGALGLVVALCFVGLQMGGMLVAQEAGLAFGQIADPNTADQSNVLSVFYAQFGSLIFLIAGGHRAVLAASLDSFDGLPLLSVINPTALGADLLLQTLITSGVIALRVAAPTIIALFLVNLAMGFLSRTMPQLNIMMFGFSLKSLLAFAVVAVSLPAAAALFVEWLDHVAIELRGLLTTGV